MIDETVKLKIRNEDDSVSSEINWQIEDRPITHANSQWLWALTIVGLAIIVFSILLKNYLLIVIVFLSAFIIFVSKNKKLELHHFQLNNEGIFIDGKFYNYENFESFWIFPARNASHSEAGGPTEIAFRRKQHLMPLLIVPFHGNEEPEIRKILESRLPENEEEESFLDLLQKKFF